MAEHLGTTCVQGGYRPGDAEPRQVPIYQSTTWKYDTSEHMGKLFDLEESGYFYTRLQNPTNDAVAAKICELEGGSAAMLTSSGQAANFFAIFNIAGAGDHVVASSAIYGGTYNLLAHTMRRMGLECTFVQPDCSDEELEAAFRDNTRAVFGETLANPALTVLDIERFAAAAHAHGVPLIVDNTFPTPVMCRPIEWGGPYRDPFHHQVHGWARGRRGRRHRGFRPLRLGRTRRQVPRSHHARRELPRRRIYRALRFGRGLHHQGHRAAHARPGLHPKPAERLPAQPGS